MADRVKKTRPKVASTLRANHLLAAILSSDDLLVMRPCSACEARGLESCDVSKLDSSRCTECVRLKRASCDVLGVSPSQLRSIASRHQELEDELLAAEERVLRLRKQKKLWFEKMMRAISRGIDSVEELERVEREEAEALAKSNAQPDPPPSSATPPLLNDDFVPLWNTVYPEVQLEPALMSDFGLLSGSPSWVAQRCVLRFRFSPFLLLTWPPS
jgi:hypothetical protein